MSIFNGHLQGMHEAFRLRVYLEQEQQPPGLRPLAPLIAHLQPLICFLHCREFLPPLGVLVRVVLPRQLPEGHHLSQ